MALQIIENTLVETTRCDHAGLLELLLLHSGHDDDDDGGGGDDVDHSTSLT